MGAKQAFIPQLNSVNLATGPLHWVTETCEPTDAFPITLSVAQVDTVVDIYASHAKCCWARFMWEGCRAECLSSENDNAAAKTKKLSALAHMIWRTQQAGGPRGVSRARDNFRYTLVNQPPPVIRGDPVGESVCTVTGTFKCHYAPPPNAQPRSTHDIHRAFPLFLAVQPTESCAAHVSNDPMLRRKTSSVREPMPQLLVLQHIALELEDSWSATYSAFSWLISPLPNTVPRLRAQHRRPKASREPLTAIHPGSAAPPSVLLKFDVYASAPVDEPTREKIIEQLSTMDTYDPKQTKVMRYGIGGVTAANSLMEDNWRTTVTRRRAKLMDILDRLYAAAGNRNACLGEKRGREDSMSPTCTLSGSLQHVGSVRSSKEIPVEYCTLANSVALGHILPRHISFPFQLENAEGKLSVIDAMSTFGDLAEAF